jgi:hypothetical protein
MDSVLTLGLCSVLLQVCTVADGQYAHTGAVLYSVTGLYGG